MSQEVTDYISKINQAWQVEVCKRLNDLIYQVVPGVTDRLQYGKPHYLKNGKYAAVIGPAKGWVSFTIFNAQSLQTPAGFFEPSDVTERQTIKIREGQTVDYDQLGKYIQQAAASIA